MHINLKNTLTGGMDLDSDSRYVNENDWRTALNIRSGVAYAGKQNVVTNVKGNVNVGYTLPNGTNKCIGTYEDRQFNTVIYFIYNSNGKHQILRYYPTETAPYGRIELQIQYNFGWTSATQIHGIDLVNGRLLYWNDPKPRKINIEKAVVVNKKKEWTLILPKTVSTITNPYVIQLKNLAGGVISTLNFNLTQTTREDIIKYIAQQINSNQIGRAHV